jgi:large subunit ribosomal protein L7/L12
MSALNDIARCPETKELADLLLNLTLAQAAALRVHLEEVHGIRPGWITLELEATTETTPPAPEPTHFTVVFAGLAALDKKMSVFKAVREIAQLGLKETRELMEAAPSTIKENVPKDEAALLQKKLVDAGARVTLVPMTA